MSARNSTCGKRRMALAVAWFVLAAAVPLPAFAWAMSSGPACRMACAKRANCCCRPRAPRPAAESASHPTLSAPFRCAAEGCATPATFPKKQCPKATGPAARQVFEDATTERTAPPAHRSLRHLADQPDHSRAPPTA